MPLLKLKTQQMQKYSPVLFTRESWDGDVLLIALMSIILYDISIDSLKCSINHKLNFQQFNDLISECKIFNGSRKTYFILPNFKTCVKTYTLMVLLAEIIENTGTRECISAICTFNY